MRGRPNRVAGAHVYSQLFSWGQIITFWVSLPVVARVCKVFFSAPYPSPYGKYGGYVRFHWLAV